MRSESMEVVEREVRRWWTLLKTGTGRMGERLKHVNISSTVYFSCTTKGVIKLDNNIFVDKDYKSH